METARVNQMIGAGIPDAEVSVAGEDCSFSVTVVSEQFRGKPPVARQKMVLGLFKEQLASGELHALSVTTITPEEKGNA